MTDEFVSSLYLHLKTDTVYSVIHRGLCPAPFKANTGLIYLAESTRSGKARDVIATDDIEVGDEVVTYVNPMKPGRNWMRPARLFDDGRFRQLDYEGELEYNAKWEKNRQAREAERLAGQDGAYL
jgi:hypothetical protein